MPRFRAPTLVAAALCAVAGIPSLLFATSASAELVAAPPTTTYTAGTPSLATITNGATAAPWNEYQGIPGDPYTSQSPGTVLPTYTPGGAETGSGATAEPNLAVYPGATSGTDGNSPYPAGTAGTPGPLNGYCGSGSSSTGSGSTPATQPAGTTLPLAPAYFPHIVRNSDGSLTGYFDYRPKDADEEIVAATSTDNGQDWTYDGEALQENPGYCPSSDINDDGEGHPNVMTIGGNTYMYTLPRAAGDMQGVGMLVHELDPTESNPLGNLPANEEVGIDPDAFVPTGTSSIDVTNGSSTTIPLTSLGTAGSPEQLIAGSFVDLTETPGTPTVITCTGLGASSLTGCTTASGSSVDVQAGDLIEQVLGFTTKSSDVGLVIPAGPNTTTGDGGLGSFTVNGTPGGATGFANPLTGTTFNSNAPNRAYVNGTPIYCSQANANPTTHIEDCTTGPGGSPLTLTSEEPVTGDPIIPATAYDTGAGEGMTSGLVAPDGIVGVLPSYPNNGTVPSGATYVMYTEKELSYYIAGETTGSGTFSSATGGTIAFTPGDYISQDMPSSGPWTVQIGATAASGGATAIIPVNCTTLNETTGSLGGCTVGSSYSGWTWASNSYIAAPGATTVSPSVLGTIGQGDSTNVAKLYKNNEDLSVLRVAYTTNGVTFSDSGLANSGIISGENNCNTNDPSICSSTSSYDDINNPSENTSPSNLNAYANNDAANGTGPSTGGSDTGGTTDTDEMRWVGSAGSIIVNPDGTMGLFLSGAWAADGDSDSFNQIFYATSTNGEYWSEPTPVVSTDYSFAASATQDAEAANGQDDPLGVSAYYSGRAYAPSVVQNPNGTLTMVFSGDRLPKSVVDAGTVLGTNSSQLYTVGTQDPALDRNILVMTLSGSTSPSVSTSTSVTSDISGSTVAGDQVTYTATVSPSTSGGEPSGTVSFATADGVISGCGAEALNGSSPDQATCTTTYESDVDNAVQASYGGDSSYGASSSTPLSTTSLASSDGGSGTAGEEVTFTATVSTLGAGASAPTGGVEFSDSAGPVSGCGTEPLTSTGSGYEATCQVDYGDPVTDYVSATYLGDDNSLGSSASFTETVGQASSTTSISSSDGGSGVVGEQITYTAVVSPSEELAPSGTVAFSGDDGVISGCGAAPVTDSSPYTATCTTSYSSPTTDDVTAAYSADPAIAASTSSVLDEVVSRDSTTVSLDVSPDPAVTGETVTLSASVLVVSPGSGVPTGTVAFKHGSVAVSGCGDVGLDGSGDATCTTTYSSGATNPQSLTATYSGSADDTGSVSNTVTEPLSLATKVATSAPASVGYDKAITLKATGLPSAATGTVDFSSGSTLLCEAAVADGMAKCSPTLPVAVGSYTIEGAYSGDDTYAPSQSEASMAVTEAATAVKAKASPASVAYGATETINASGLSSLVTGTVTFTTGDNVLCSLPAAATVACTVPSGLSVGTYPVTVEYGGDGNFTSSQAAVSFTVTQAKVPFTASASPSPAAASQDVTVSATDLPSDATGSVTFEIKSTVLCTVELTEPSATCQVPAGYGDGTHDVTVTYSGDGNYLSQKETASFKVTGSGVSVS